MFDRVHLFEATAVLAMLFAEAAGLSASCALALGEPPWR